MPHKKDCTKRGELGIDDEDNDFCMNCGEIIKPNEDSVIIQAKFLSEKKKKPESFDEMFNRLIKPIVDLYWKMEVVKIDPPTIAGYFYIYLKTSYLDFENLKKFDKDIGKHAWYLISIISQEKGYALRCKT